MRERFFKQIIALIAAYLLLFTGTGVSAKSFSDTAGLPCEEATEALRTLGIIEGKGEIDKFTPEDTLTRAETAALIVRALGLHESGSGKEIFSDVTWEHWALDVITTASELGFVCGMGDGTFRPDDTVTYNQAVKIAISMLGYGVQAEALGGYPAGYLIMANRLEILKGVSMEDQMTRGNMAILLYNTLDAVPSEAVSYGKDGGGQFKELDGTTLLARYRQIYLAKGTLSATYGITLENPGRTLLRGEVAIGTDIYMVPDTSAEALIGQEVKAYYEKEDDARLAVIIVPEGKSQVVTIDASLVSDKTTLSTLVYEKSGKDEKLSIDGAKIIVNGVAKVSPQKEDLMPKVGRLTVIESTAGNVATVLVDAYAIYIADLINAEDEEVVLKPNSDKKGVITLRDEKDAKVIINDSSGNTISVSDIKEWDVLSVASAEDESVTRIICARESITGTLSEMSAEDVTIEGVVYPVTADAEKKISLGLKGRFVLSHLGHVAGVDTTSVSMHNYGYLVAAGYSKGLNARAQLKVFTQDGQMVVFETTDTVHVDKKPYKTDEMLNASSIGTNGKGIPQLIRYELMENNKTISGVETAEDFTLMPFDDARHESFSKSLYIPETGKIGSSEIGFRAGSLRMFDGGYLIRSNTKIFFVPEDRSKEDEYRMIDPSSLLDFEQGGDAYKNVSLFDVNDEHLVSAMLWEAAAGVSNGIPTFRDGQAVIKAVTMGYDEETGETGRQFTLYTAAGKEIKYIIEDKHKVFYKCAITNPVKDKANSFVDGDGYKKIYAEDLNAGDVITYTAKSGKIDILNVIFRAASPKEYDQYWGLFNDSRAPWKTTMYRYYGSQTNSFGTVTRIGESFMLMDVPDRDDPNTIYERYYPVSTASGSSILHFDMRTGALTKIAPSAIGPGDKAFVSWYGNSPRFIIVYDNVDM